MALYRLDASIRTDNSASREIADIVESEWLEGAVDRTVNRRDIGMDPLPSTAWAAAVGAAFTPVESRTNEQLVAGELASTLVDELASAEALLFAIPLYNFGVSQHFTTWVDLVIADSRMKPGGASAIAGKPLLVAVRGGNYSPGTPREGWDHASDYYRRVLADVWGADLRVVEREFTLVGVVPALD